MARDKDKEKWFKFYCDFFDDPKIKILDALANGPSYSDTATDADMVFYVYLRLMCMAATELDPEGNVSIFKDQSFDIDDFSFLINRPEFETNQCLELLQQYGLIKMENNCVHIEDWETSQYFAKLEEKRAKDRERKQKQREKEKAEQEVASEQSQTEEESPMERIKRIKEGR